MSLRYLSSVLLLLIVMADAAAAADSSGGNTILIEDFANPIHKWSTMNDPVMGGQSYSALTVEDGVAKFAGKCAIVPFLKAPGFITMVTGGFFSFHNEVFPDVSTCSGLAFSLKSETAADYKGYRISFGNVHVKGGRHASGYKAGPLVGIGNEFSTLTIPFEEFSSKWDDATGDITVSCKEDKQYCPNQKWLSNMKTMSFWAEGVEGDIDLEIEKIWAVECSSEATLLAASLLEANATSLLNIGGGHQITVLVCLMAIMGIMAVVLGNTNKRRQLPLSSNQQEYEQIPEEAVL